MGAGLAEPETPVEAPDGDWRTDAKGRQYAPARGRSGVVYRENDETLEQAYARDAKPRDKPPKPRPKTKKAAQPQQVSLQQLEHDLADALSMPSMLAGAVGDEWAANHFTREGPVLARNLVSAAEHNPWLRAKLEAALAGDELLVKLITTVSVAGALFAYTFPPIIYYFDPKFVPAKARELYQIPDRKQLKAAQRAEEEEAERAQAAQAAAAAQAAEAAAA